MYLIANNTSSNCSSQWEEISPVVVPACLDEEVGGSNVGDQIGDGSSNTHSVLSMATKMKEAKDSELTEVMSLRIVASATHTLMEAVNLAMANQDWVFE